MAKAKGQGASKKNAYSSYKAENRYQKNREKRLKRAIKQQPNNEQLKQALKNIRYRRYKPTYKYGWVSSKDVRYNPYAGDGEYVGPGISGANYREIAQMYKVSNGHNNACKYNKNLVKKPSMSENWRKFLEEGDVKNKKKKQNGQRSKINSDKRK